MKKNRKKTAHLKHENYLKKILEIRNSNPKILEKKIEAGKLSKPLNRTSFNARAYAKS